MARSKSSAPSVAIPNWHPRPPTLSGNGGLNLFSEMVRRKNFKLKLPSASDCLEPSVIEVQKLTRLTTTFKLIGSASGIGAASAALVHSTKVTKSGTDGPFLDLSPGGTLDPEII